MKVPGVSFSKDELDKLTDRIQNAGTEVVNAKAGAVSTYKKYNLMIFYMWFEIAGLCYIVDGICWC